MQETTIACRIVEVCCFRFVNNTPEYLLLKRSSSERIYPDLWQLVSGTIGEGESALHAALREFREETGLVPSGFWVVPFVNAFYDHDYNAVNLSPFFAAQVRPTDEPKLSSEHQVYEWLRFGQAHERLVWPGQRQGLTLTHSAIAGGGQVSLLTKVAITQT
jgi:8-oxo-dGTP pyrophosphatase MutT (NUDIX family)